MINNGWQSANWEDNERIMELADRLMCDYKNWETICHQELENMMTDDCSATKTHQENPNNITKNSQGIPVIKYSWVKPQVDIFMTPND